MQQYHHILLAVELDQDCDQHLIEKTKAIVARNSAKVSLVHSNESVANFGAAYGVNPGIDVEEVLLDQARTLMQNTAEQLGVADNDQHLVIGSAKHTILEHAKKLQVDLIIVGSHGRHGVRLLLGSTATAVLHSALCDVLAVRLPS